MVGGLPGRRPLFKQNRMDDERQVVMGIAWRAGCPPYIVQKLSIIM